MIPKLQKIVLSYVEIENCSGNNITKQPTANKIRYKLYSLSLFLYLLVCEYK